MRITESQLKSVVERLLEQAYQDKMDDSKPVKVDTLYGMKSVRKTLKFKNKKAYEKWADSDKADDYTVQRVYQD